MSLNVEATGFEPATPRPPAECATGLRHVPNYFEDTMMYRLISMCFLRFTDIYLQLTFGDNNSVAITANLILS